jgi:hypothetical protein
MMVAVSTSETAAIYQTTRRSIPGDSHLYTRRLERLKSHPNVWFAFRSTEVKVYFSFAEKSLYSYVCLAVPENFAFHSLR